MRMEGSGFMVEGLASMGGNGQWQCQRKPEAKRMYPCARLLNFWIGASLGSRVIKKILCFLALSRSLHPSLPLLTLYLLPILHFSLAMHLCLAQELGRLSDDSPNVGTCGFSWRFRLQGDVSFKRFLPFSVLHVSHFRDVDCVPIRFKLVLFAVSMLPHNPLDNYILNFRTNVTQAKPPQKKAEQKMFDTLNKNSQSFETESLNHYIRISVQLGLPVWSAPARSRSKINEFVPQTQHFNLRMERKKLENPKRRTC